MLGLPLELLTDICSGQPLVYLRDAHAIRIYGFGLDRDDDSGRTMREMSDDDDGDIVVEIRWPDADTKPE